MPTKNNNGKTEDINDFLRWLNQQGTGSKKKEKIDYDFIVYGVSRDNNLNVKTKSRNSHGN